MRILLIEDDIDLASGLITALSHAQYRCDHVKDGQQALLALDHPPDSPLAFDCVILDLGLPTVDGQTVLKRLRAQGEKVPVLILSAKDATKDRVLGLDMGADDYMTKPFELDELLARLRVLARRQQGSSENILTLGALSVDITQFLVTWHGMTIDLQRREMMLLRRFVQYPQQVFTRSQLEEHLYGWSEGVESNTIDVHIHNLRKKIAPDIIKTIRGIGYRLGNLS